MENRMMLHCGAAHVERNAIGQVALPEATDTYMPVGHDVIADMAQKELEKVGYTFGDEAHAMTHDGKRYFGLIELINGGGQNDEHALVLGLRNSIDKSFPAAMGFGSHVFVCDNLAFGAEIRFSRKHTVHIMRDLPDLITRAVAQTTAYKRNQEMRFEHYQNAKLTQLRADHAIIDMVRRGAINTSRVEKVVREWDEPSHNFGGRTAWRLFNAATEALKGAPMHDVSPRTIRLQGLMDDVTDFVPEPVNVVEHADWQG